MKNKSALFFSYSLVTVLFVICIIIYGFDLNFGKSGSRKALTSQINNSGTTNYFYKINDHFSFGVFTDREEGELDIVAVPYMKDYYPFCFFCGWNTNDNVDNRSITQPYLNGNIIYDLDSSNSEYRGLPKGSFATLNLKSGEYGFVKNLNEICENPRAESRRLTRQYVSENFNEISFSSSDDEDCYIAFGAIFLCYSILIVWTIIAWITKIRRRQKSV